MEPTPSFTLFALIGILAGVLAGLFGIGGGIVIVPALIYLAGFSQHQATATSLAILLPPVGLAAVYEYYRHGHVNMKVSLIVALFLFIGSWFGAFVANKVNGPYLRLLFGVFVICMGGYLVYGALRKMNWI
jgi:uncharacterized membrane protein YfcA